jgi:tRNA(Ile)-lysidine synthase
MNHQFKQFIAENNLFQPADKVLLAISGGIDSMVMWQLFEVCGLNYSVIHCNFRFRGAESDADEALVTRMADERGVQLYVKKFDTREYASLTGVSIEMAARELRYNWFREILSEEKIPWLATAHHQDDLLETFFINLVRKTGIKGLTGFKPRNGSLIRPMLFTCRREIEEWAALQQVEYRTDLTNQELIFQRNFIRHQIIPSLEQLNQAFRKNLTETIANLRDVEDFYDTEVNRQLKRITNADSANPELSVSALLKMAHPKQLLFEWMSRYDFNPATIDQVFNFLEAEPGKQFYSRTHRLIIDRNRLIISDLKEKKEQLFYLDKNDLELFDPVHLSMSITEGDIPALDPDPRVAYLDAGKLEYPLVLRKWQPGEYFQPLGMQGFKKLSDFFVDQKFSIPEKEQTWIVYSGDKVVWIVGHRIDNRFRITRETSKVLMLRLHL